MKKLQRMREQKRIQQQEDIEVAKKHASSTGLGFVDHELPPDEVDEKDVARTLWHTLRTFIPFSNEYYEAMAAEEEMDDLKKIRIEKVRAADFLTMAKMGKHDEALETMMAETNYDFFYFNKLKFKMIAEGKFKFDESVTKANIFSILQGGPNRNRLRKAINQVYSALDSKLTDELARISAFSDGTVTRKKYGNEQPCMWRGKTKGGEALRCDNPRLMRPVRDENAMATLMGITATTAKKDAPAEYFAYCAYHVPMCVSLNHEASQNVKIRIPNAHSLCAECYMMEHHKRPPAVRLDNAPGVVPLNLKVQLSDLSDNPNAVNAAMRLAYQRELMKYMSNRHFATPRTDPSPPLNCHAYRPLPPAESWVQKMGRVANQVAYKRRLTLYGVKSATKIQATFRMHRVYRTHLRMHYDHQVEVRWQAAIRIQGQMRRFLIRRAYFAMRTLYITSVVIIQRHYRGFVVRYALLRHRAGVRILRFMKRIYFLKFKDSVILLMQLRIFYQKRTAMATIIQRVYRGYSKRCLVFHMRYWKILSQSYARKLQRAYLKYQERKRRVVKAIPGEEYVYQQVAQRLAGFLQQLYRAYQARRAHWQDSQVLPLLLQPVIRSFLAKRGMRKLQRFRLELQRQLQPRHAIAVYQSLVTNARVNQYVYTQFIQPKILHQVRQQQAEERLHRIANYLPRQFQEATEVHPRIFLPALWRYYQERGFPLSQTEQQVLLSRFRNPITGGILIRVLDDFLTYHTFPCIRHGRMLCGTCVYHEHCSLPSCSCARYQPHASKSKICQSCCHAKHMHVIYPLQAREVRERRLQEKITEAHREAMGEDLDEHGEGIRQEGLLQAGEDEDTLSSEKSIGKLDDGESILSHKSSRKRRVPPPEILPAFALEREADMSLPVGVTGQSIDKVLLPPVDYEDILGCLEGALPDQLHGEGKGKGLHPFHAQREFFASLYAQKMTHTGGFRAGEESQLWTETLRHRGDWLAGKRGRLAATQASSPLATALATGQVEGDAVHKSVYYWQQPHLSATQPSRAVRNMRPVLRSRLKAVSTRKAATPSSLSSPSLIQEIEDTFHSLVRPSSSFSSSSSPTKSLVRSLSRSELVGQERLPIDGGGGGDRSTNEPLVVFAPVKFAHEAPSQVINYDNFWQMVAKHPNKSVEDFHRSFEVNLPLVVAAEKKGLAYSVEYAALYVNVLNLLVFLEAHIHADHPVLLKLIFNHIQVFERHWRSMVIDLRNGRLSRAIATHPHHAQMAQTFAALHMPRPQLAEKLDRVFRTLGFHNKVLGKEIQTQAYAPKRTARELRAACLAFEREEGEGIGRSRPASHLGEHCASSQYMVDDGTSGKERRPSLSFEPSDVAVQSMSRPGTRSGTATCSADRSPPHRAISPVGLKGGTSGGLTAPPSRGSEDLAVVNMFSRPGTSDAAGQDRPTSSSRQAQALAQFTQSLSADRETPSVYRRGAKQESDQASRKSSQRRHSQSEAQRGAQRDEVQQVHYDLITGPREFDIPAMQLAYRLRITGSSASQPAHALPTSRTGGGEGGHRATMTPLTAAKTQEKVNLFNLQSVVSLSKDRYVCPVPGCGKSFYSAEACFRHMKVHENKQRLAIATPLSDAHLHYYWPRDIPWSLTAPPLQSSSSLSASLTEPVTSTMYSELQLPPGSIACRFPSCPQVFSTVHKLHIHMRLVHKCQHPSHRSQGYYTIHNVYLTVPPDKFPYTTCTLPHCISHARPSRACAQCMHVEACTKTAPKPPYQLVHSIDIDWSIKRNKLRLLRSQKREEDVFNQGTQAKLVEDDRSLVLWLEEESTGDNFKGRCVHLVFDRSQCLWIGVERLYTVRDLRSAANRSQQAFATHEAFSEEELIPQHIVRGQDRCRGEDLEWVPVHILQWTVPMEIRSRKQCKPSCAPGFFIREDHL